MRNTLYRRLVHCINEYQTWIEVVDANLYKTYAVPKADRNNHLISRTLALRAYKAHDAYSIGTTWMIPEHDLDKALAAYRKQNVSFRKRIKQGEAYLSANDTEAIIRLATHDIIRLKLMIYPDYLPPKHYYL